MITAIPLALVKDRVECTYPRCMLSSMRELISQQLFGVSFFEHDHGDGAAIRYHVPYVLSLVADAVHSDAVLTTKRDGIVGIPRTDKHLVFMGRSDIYLINLSVLSSLAHYSQRWFSPAMSGSTGSRIPTTWDVHYRLLYHLQLCAYVSSTAVQRPSTGYSPPYILLPCGVQDMSKAGRGQVPYLFAVYEGRQKDMGSVLRRNVPEGGLAET